MSCFVKTVEKYITLHIAPSTPSLSPTLIVSLLINGEILGVDDINLLLTKTSKVPES